VFGERSVRVRHSNIQQRPDRDVDYQEGQAVVVWYCKRCFVKGLDRSGSLVEHSPADESAALARTRAAKHEFSSSGHAS
jgi:hypothetical protein